MAAQLARLDFGRLVTASLSLARRRFLSIAAATMLLGFVTAAVGYALLTSARSGRPFEPPIAMFVQFGVMAFCALLLQVFVARLARAEASGRRERIGAMLDASFRRAPTIAILAALVASPAVVAQAAGLWLLTHLGPGASAVLAVSSVLLMALMAFAVSPSLAIEAGGLGASIRGMARLSRGNRWLLIGALLATLVLTAVALIVVMVLVAMAASAWLARYGGQAEMAAASQALAAFVVFLWPAPSAVVGAAAYCELRELAEGLSPEGAGEVFG